MVFAMLNGNQRNSDCEVVVRVGYRDDTTQALWKTARIVASGTGTVPVWNPFAVGNGWDYSVNLGNLVGVTSLALQYDSNGFVTAFTLNSIPADCVAQVPAPVIQNVPASGYASGGLNVRFFATGVSTSTVLTYEVATFANPVARTGRTVVSTGELLIVVHFSPAS